MMKISFPHLLAQSENVDEEFKSYTAGSAHIIFEYIGMLGYVRIVQNKKQSVH